MFVFASFLAALAVAEAAYCQHEERIEDPSWVKVAKPKSNAVLPVRIGLAQQNLDKGPQWLLEISDPSSPKYGKHWTPEEIVHAFQPKQESYDAVHSWLADSGIATDRVDTNVNHWISFNATVSEIESLFKSQYHIFKHSGTGDYHIASDSYSLPEELSAHIDIVTPTVHFDRPVKNQAGGPISHPRISPYDGSRPRTNALVKSNLAYGANDVQNLVQESTALCYEYTFPGCVRYLYDMPINYQNNSGNSFGMPEYAPNNYVLSDMNLFYQLYSARQINQFPIFDSVDTGMLYPITDINNEAEPALDFQIAVLTWPQQSTLFQVGNNSKSASFNNFLDAIDASYCTYMGGDQSDPVFTNATCGAYAPPYVLSTSYGYNENSLTAFYENRQCYEYMKLGLAGTTVLYSSGDYGVAGQGGSCPLKNGVYPFRPSFPSGCPWVTSVGATSVIGQTNIGNTALTQPEQATTQFASGGGFSNRFTLPSYQASAVSGYMTSYPPPYTAAQYNNTGNARAFPDISADGENYIVVLNSSEYLIGGTSMSSPIIGTVFTLINQARLNAGKTPVGFVNPALYANPGMLNDVTIGNNPGCHTNGFNVTSGWDPITGLGTPNYPAMLSYFLSLS